MTYDLNLLLEAVGLEPKLITDLNRMLGEVVNGDPVLYYGYVKKCVQFVAINGIRLPQTTVGLLNAMKNQHACAEISAELEKDPEFRYYSEYTQKHGWVAYVDKFFPYQDLRRVRDAFKEIEIEIEIGAENEGIDADREANDAANHRKS